MVKKIRILYDKTTCIGNLACMAADPERWEKDKKGKVNLVEGKKQGENLYVLEQEYDEKEMQIVLDGANACPVNAIGVEDAETGEELVKRTVSAEGARVIETHYDDNKEFILDQKGYFLIRADRKNKNIEIGFCKERNIVEVKIVGKKPIDIYQTILKEKIITRPDHAAYLGRELQKAYIALQQGIEYVQDDELDFKKKLK